MPGPRSELEAVLRAKFGADSPMYRDGLAVYDAGRAQGTAQTNGIPGPYAKYWKPYRTIGILHHTTTLSSLAAIKERGLEPRDPFPRPWAGMSAVYLGDPADPQYRDSELNVIEHARAKGSEPVLLEIRTSGQLYKCTEPGRSSQVISLDPISPADIAVIIQP